MTAFVQSGRSEFADLGWAERLLLAEADIGVVSRSAVPNDRLEEKKRALMRVIEVILT